MCNYDCQYTFHREHTSTHVFFLARTNGGQGKKKRKQKIKKTTKKTMVIMQLFKSSKSLEQQFENESLRFLTSSQTIAHN